ncbi:hypothetical protein BRADI_2g13196v3 [Brachypodium distachyon]|uniref:Uncharacterized protein n=1 Tax=Brachypodium distachyon TaxID=15368 RepID=A0A2K2D8C6_BRADI|nr:hypothetical protein BRADI_2g13196v3 [Brachypodium distachyon]
MRDKFKEMEPFTVELGSGIDVISSKFRIGFLYPIPCQPNKLVHVNQNEFQDSGAKRAVKSSKRISSIRERERCIGLFLRGKQNEI